VILILVKINDAKLKFMHIMSPNLTATKYNGFTVDAHSPAEDFTDTAVRDA